MMEEDVEKQQEKIRELKTLFFWIAGQLFFYIKSELFFFFFFCGMIDFPEQDAVHILLLFSCSQIFHPDEHCTFSFA